MKKNILFLLMFLVCMIFSSCIFEVEDEIAYFEFTDDKTFEYRWNLTTKESYSLKLVKVEGKSVGHFTVDYMVYTNVVHLPYDVEEGKNVTLVFESSVGDTVYITFKKDKENFYPKIKHYRES